jgi:hypothetical protein
MSSKLLTFTEFQRRVPTAVPNAFAQPFDFAKVLEAYRMLHASTLQKIAADFAAFTGDPAAHDYEFEAKTPHFGAAFCLFYDIATLGYPVAWNAAAGAEEYEVYVTLTDYYAGHATEETDLVSSDEWFVSIVPSSTAYADVNVRVRALLMQLLELVEGVGHDTPIVPAPPPVTVSAPSSSSSQGAGSMFASILFAFILFFFIFG